MHRSPRTAAPNWPCLSLAGAQISQQLLPSDASQEKWLAWHNSLDGGWGGGCWRDGTGPWGAAVAPSTWLGTNVLLL